MPLQAATYQHQILLDTDNNPATGCDVNVSEQGYTGVIGGVDHRVTLEVDNQPVIPGQVTQITHAGCTAGSFGGATVVDAGDWNLGNNNGVSGADVIEGYIPRNLIGNPDQITVAFYATQSGASDVLQSSGGTNGGSPIVVTLAAA